MWDPFDFNGDGHTSPAEEFIGLEMAGAMGYGAGLSEAEERVSYLRDEYEEKLERKRRRIEELEDELEELREERDNWWDDDDDWEDEDDYDDDDEWDDEDDDDDEYGYDGFYTIGPIYHDMTKRIVTKVAGITYDLRVYDWLPALEGKELEVTLRRDPNNAFDSDAVEVLVNGEVAGYIPSSISDKVALVMDLFGRVEVERYSVREIHRKSSESSPLVTVDLHLKMTRYKNTTG